MQWFSLKRQHAVVVLADNLYYSKFRDYCKVSAFYLQNIESVCMQKWVMFVLVDESTCF